MKQSKPPTIKEDLIEVNKQLKMLFNKVLPDAKIKYLNDGKIMDKLDEIILELDWNGQ